MQSKLYVGNLKYDVTEKQLSELFEKHGIVKSVKLFADKGFCFVEMASGDEASLVMGALNGTDFMGRQIRIAEARPFTPRANRY